MKTTASITSDSKHIKRTEGQEKQLKRLLEDGAPKAYALILKKFDPDKDGMDRLLCNGDEVVDAMVDAVLGKSCKFTTPNQYSDEEVESDYVYPREYKGPRPIKEQVRKLAELLGLDPSHALEYADKVLPTLTLQTDAKGSFAIISPIGLEKLVPQADSPEDRYCKGVLQVLGKIAASRRFHNYREGQIDPSHLRQHAQTVAAIAKIAESQKGDILIVLAQLGLRHRGRSVRRARVCFTGGEYGLRSLDVGAIVLTHPERFVRFEELDTDCSGDEFAPDADGAFSKSPYFHWYDVALYFVTFVVVSARGYYGAASGFPPQ